QAGRYRYCSKTRKNRMRTCSAKSTCRDIPMILLLMPVPCSDYTRVNLYGETLPDAHCATYRFSSLSTHTSCGCTNIFSACDMGISLPSEPYCGGVPPMLDTTRSFLSS